MGFENIQLPSSVLAGLYKQVVVTDDYEMNRIGGERTAERIAPAEGVAGSNPVFPTAKATQAPSADYSSKSATGTGSGVPETSSPLSVGAPQSAIPQMPEPSQPTSQPVFQTPPPSDAPYRFLGKNARKVAIIVYSPTEPYLPEDQLQLLTKMLDACKLNLGDVAILNMATQAINYTRLEEQLHPQKTLLFGIQPEQIGLPLNFPPYKEQEYAGCTYLLASPIDAMNQPNEEGKNLKGKLWGCLKKMFNI